VEFDPAQPGGGGKQCRQTGFAAIAAIFLVIVLAALGGFMLMFSNTQQLTAAQDLQGSRAFWAARAGLEWGVARAVGTLTCDASTTLMPFDGGFSVEVTCGQVSYMDSESVTIYTITSRAFPSGGVPGSIGYVERSMTATVEIATP